MNISKSLGNMFDPKEILGLPSNEAYVEEATVVPPKREDASQQRNIKKVALFTWEAPLRPMKTMTSNPKFVRSMGIIAIVVGLLLVAMQEFLLIIAIASLVFVKYLLTSTPSEGVVHEVSTHGLSFAGQLYPWEDLKQFYFVDQDGTSMMLVDVASGLPGRLYFVIHSQDKVRLQDIVNDYIPYLEVAPKDVMKDAYNSVLDRFTTQS